MADYREISQEYAQGGLRAAFLLNGGAAVALLSQAASLHEKGLAHAITMPMLFWSFGVAAATCAWSLAFLSTRYVDKSEREPPLASEHIRTSNTYMTGGLVLFLGSIVCFLLGCVWLALAI